MRGARVVAIHHKGVFDSSQKFMYKPGAYHNWSPIADSNVCMDAPKNVNGIYLYLWKCHNGVNQRFEVRYASDFKKKIVKSTGLRPWAPFMIRSRGAGKRVLYWGRNIGGNQYEMAIRTAKYTKEEIYYFDPKTGHIKNFKDRAWAIGIQNGRSARGSRLVLQRVRDDNSQKWDYRSNQYHNWNPFSNNRLTIDVAHGDKDGSIVHMWTHHNGWNQRFEADYKVTKPIYKSTNLRAGQPFFIRSNMNGRRVLYYTKKDIGGGQFEMRIRTPQYTKEEIFVFDGRTGHIRNF